MIMFIRIMIYTFVHTSRNGALGTSSRAIIGPEPEAALVELGAEDFPIVASFSFSVLISWRQLSGNHHHY